MESRAIGHQSSWTGFGAASDATAATPNVLNINEPIIVPRPISDFVMNVPITFVKNSGVDVATVNCQVAKTLVILFICALHMT